MFSFSHGDVSPFRGKGLSVHYDRECRLSCRPCRNREKGIGSRGTNRLRGGGCKPSVKLGTPTRDGADRAGLRVERTCLPSARARPFERGKSESRAKGLP